MKKLSIIIFSLFCIISLVSCGNTVTTNQNIYSFSGSNELFTVSNGTVVLSEAEETFCGGDLKVNSQEILSGVTYYSTTFYILTDGEKRTVMSNRVTDMTGVSVSPEGVLGKISGDDLIVGNKVENIEEFENNLYFELKTVDLSGKENVYQLQLTVTQVS